MKQNIIDWMKAAIKAFSFQDYQDIINLLFGGMKLNAGGAGTSFIPSTNAQQVAFQQMQMTPLTLQVLIDGTEIRNASLVWFAGEVQTMFNSATAQVSTS